MPPKARFMVRLPEGKSIGCDTADAVIDALNDLKDTKGVTVSDMQTGMNDLSREAIEELANGERE
jgi:hypothetical protein